MNRALPKIFLFIVITLSIAAVMVHSQDVNVPFTSSGGVASAIRTAAVAPTTCSKDQVYFNTTSNKFFGCTAANTWSELFASGSDSTISIGTFFDYGQDRGIVINANPVGVNGSSGISIGADDAHNVSIIWVPDPMPSNSYAELSAVQDIRIEAGNLRLQTVGLGNVTIGKFMAMQAVVFTDLGALANGTVGYCSNCTIANPCASGGTGAIAKRLNNVWVCN